MIITIYAVLLCIGPGFHHCQLQAPGETFATAARCARQRDWLNSHQEPQLRFYCVKRPKTTWAMAE